MAGSLFYGAAQDNGGPGSDPSILSNGDLTWSGNPLYESQVENSSAVGCDQQGAVNALSILVPRLRR